MSSIPEEVRSFVADHLSGSSEQLRIVLLLESTPEREWTVEAIAEELQMPTSTAGMRLFLLTSTGVIASSGPPMVYRYSPSTPRIDAMVRLIADTLASSPEALRALTRRAEDDPLKSFADAFDLRKKNG